MMHPDRTTPPPIRDFSSIQLPEFEHYTLPNGIAVFLYNAGDEDVTALSILWKAGALDLPLPGRSGVLTDMLLQGTKDHSGARISQIIESNGAWIKFLALDHLIMMNVKMLNHTADEVLPCIAEIISRPDFPEEALESIKKKRAAARTIELQRPALQAAIAVRREFYGKDSKPAQYTTPEDILSVSREELADIHRRLMISNVPEIILTGKVTPEIRAALARTIGQIRFTPENPDRIVKTMFPMPDNVGRRIVNHSMPESVQTGVRYMMAGVAPTHPDAEALNFAVTALGGYFGSRLMANIREDKGYTYGIYSVTSPQEDLHELIISCDCDNRYAQDVVKEIDSEIRRLATEPIPPEEMETVRNIIISGLASSLDSHINVGKVMEMLRAMDLSSDHFATKFRGAMEMTPDRVMQAARKYLLDNPKVIALAGGQSA